MKLKEIISSVLAVFCITSIINFFQNDRNEIVSDRGLQVLNDESLMSQVREEINRRKIDGQSGPIIIKFK